MALVTHTFLLEHRDAVLGEWERLACLEPCAVKLAGEPLRDHLPDLLEELCDWMERGDGREGVTWCPSAALHAAHRLQQGVPLWQVLREYRLLRTAILRALGGGKARSRASAATVSEIARLDDCLDAAMSHAVEHFVATRDAARVEPRAGLFRDASGSAVGVVLRDVTDRRRAEEALRASEERLRAHVDNSPLAVVEYDPQFTITRWSKEAERLFGWPADEIIGRKLGEVRWVHDDDLETVGEELGRLLSGKRTRTRSANRNFRRDGSVVHCEWYNSAVHDAAGKLSSILSQGLDVTDQRAAQEALRAADHRKTEFLAVLSHELRNHLAPINNCLRLLERTPPGSPRSHLAREIIGRQMDHVTRLVDDLLDISRINAGKVRLERARFDAREVVRRVCEDVGATFEERGIALKLDVAREPLWIEADETRLAQIVGNLLGNAQKFTSPPGSVEVTVARVAGAVELRVRDTGVGIDPGLLGRIFEPFTQAEREWGTTPGGIGIGLAIVKTLVTMHGGTVRAESEGKGKGAALVVTLPLAAPPEVPAAKPAATPTSSLAILVVEDNRDAAETLEHVLELEGHRVRHALDGRSGIETFRDLAPDVLLCDVGLPDLSGYDVIRTIRGLETGRPVFAVALTGYAQADDVERAIGAGFDAHLPKPAPLERLDRLLALAGERRATAAHQAPAPPEPPSP